MAKSLTVPLANQTETKLVSSRLATNTRRQPPTEKKLFVDFVGSGDIQKSLSEGKDINANTGLGIIFERFNGVIDGQDFILDKILQSYEIEATINIATTADTINSAVQNSILQNRRSYGSYVLNPVSAKQSLYINSNFYFGYPSSNPGFAKLAHYISGLNFRIISSNSVWQYDTTSTNLGVLALRAGIFHEFFPDNYRLTKEGRSRYSLFLGLNYTFRGIFGDISAAKNDDLRLKILGSSQTKFSGLEANFGFRLNNIRAEFQMPVLSNKAASIEGLTNSQFLFSIRFVGGFALKLE
ncbi:MAG: hypothetical protein JNN29_04935 [Chitinophagaceae bacterium]|nr:hypothetical protein [Chitinophagaceae bacterium]